MEPAFCFVRLLSYYSKEMCETLENARDTNMHLDVT
jgi:hypothetical protein